MKLIFIGSAHEVTGSCHYLQACGKHILIDCGMEQGKDVYENVELPVSASEVDYVLLTHAHIDHSGLLPLMYAKGFKGQVYTTKATTDLCNVMLRDSAHIQEFETEWKNRKATRAGKPKVEPLYKMEHAVGVMDCFIPCEYDEMISIFEGIQIRFTDVGHLLGSASIEVWLKEGELEKKVVFSGDIGNAGQPIIKNPHYLKDADYVVMESTYGDRTHKEIPDYVIEFTKIIQETFDKGGNVVVPSFAVGRTQELLYFLRRIKAENLVKGHDGFEVYVDSPLAIETTNIFGENFDTCFDEESLRLIKQGINPISFPDLRTTVSSDESKEINFNNRPKIIISASGMCEAGRIRHHLKHNLWREESTILFVGYQANGTLGRYILDGATTVNLFGEHIDIKAKIKKLEGISGHADLNGLMAWLSSFEPKPKVFIVHGEDQVCENFKTYIENEHGYEAIAPYTGGEYDFATDTMVKEGVKEKITKVSAKTQHAQSVYDRLLVANKRLRDVIVKNEGMSNKDLSRFADQIVNLCEKWDR